MATRRQQLDRGEVGRVQVDGPHVGLAVLVVQLGEAPLVALLLAERAHDADARQRLLEVGGDQRDLLAREPVGARRGDAERERCPTSSTGNTRNVTSARPGSSSEQDHRRADQRQRRRRRASDAVGDELVERLHVVGQARDQHARLVARVEADRQPLEVAEDLDAQVLERALADPVDQVGLRRTSRPS